MFELDHVFVAVAPGAPELAPFLDRGFTEGPRHAHAGQGTASAGVFFANAYLEFIWLEDPACAGTDPVAQTHLRERLSPGRGVNPFGFGLRPGAEGSSVPPFATWDYCPPYLPDGAAILMGRNADRLTEPLLFVLPWKNGPGFEAPDHPSGVRRMTALSLQLPAGGPASAELEQFLTLGLVGLRRGRTALLSVELDHGKHQEVADFRPALPVIVKW